MDHVQCSEYYTWINTILQLILHFFYIEMGYFQNIPLYQMLEQKIQRFSITEI